MGPGTRRGRLRDAPTIEPLVEKAVEQSDIVPQGLFEMASERRGEFAPGQVHRLRGRPPEALFDRAREVSPYPPPRRRVPDPAKPTLGSATLTHREELRLEHPR